mgnify:CR=1 FL=1
MKKTMIKVALVAGILAVVFALVPQQDNKQVAEGEITPPIQTFYVDPGTGGRGWSATDHHQERYILLVCIYTNI